MKIQADKIKAHDADRLANSLLAAAAKAFENPQVQAEFEAWKAKRQQKGAVSYGPH